MVRNEARTVGGATVKAVATGIMAVDLAVVYVVRIGIRN